MSDLRSHKLVIRTPEGYAFSLQLAGPVSRFLAWSIDLLITVFIMLAIIFALAATGLLFSDIALGLMQLVLFVVWFGYGIIFEWFWHGRTLGKRVLKLRVMDEQALRLSFSQVVTRNLLRIVDCLPGFYLIGGLACFFSRRCQRLGDLAAGTIVVSQARPPELNAELALGGKYNSFREHPHLEARLRQRVSPELAGLAMEAVIRRDELAPQARVELFAAVAGALRRAAAFPPEAVEGMSDEQYVRNCLDSLLRKPGEQNK
ncbi:MAG: RDD family protein [Planctomycetes bacterium]|nr:RDD family protein [Planctomycetota bacterium]